MKIAIYEPVHLDWVIPYAELLMDEDIDVTFITSANFLHNLQPILTQKNPRYTWDFFHPESSVTAFTRKMYAVLKNRYDLVILNSADSKHLILFTLLVLLKPRRVLINLHDINNFFKIKPALNIKTNIRSVGKKLLLHLANGFIVNTEAMKEYIQKNKLTKKPVYWLQPVYYKPLITSKKTTSIKTIVISGSIDERRRDYKLVLEIIQEMLSKKIAVKWILAGKATGDYGIVIIEKAKELQLSGADILFFTEEIPEKEFQEIIAGCDLILSPLVSSTTIHDNIAEVYGETKGSGNVYDSIRHAKPYIVPAAVAVPKEIVSSCIFYLSKEDLVTQLSSVLLNDMLMAEFTQKARENAEQFSKETIKKMFTTAILDFPL